MVMAVVAIAFVACKKNPVESNDDFAIIGKDSSCKGMGTGDVTVVFPGVKEYYTHTEPDGTTTVELYCLPPYPNNVCAIFSVPEEVIKNYGFRDVSGTMLLQGIPDSSDEIPVNVEIPVKRLTIDIDNNMAKFVMK